MFSVDRDQLIFNFGRRAGDKARQAEQVLQQDDISDEEKLRRVLALGEVNLLQAQGNSNFKLTMFLCQKDNIERLLKFAIGAPEDADNEDEAYK